MSDEGLQAELRKRQIVGLNASALHLQQLQGRVIIPE
jgi:hypothetical protein